MKNDLHVLKPQIVWMVRRTVLVLVVHYEKCCAVLRFKNFDDTSMNNHVFNQNLMRYIFKLKFDEFFSICTSLCQIHFLFRFLKTLSILLGFYWCFYLRFLSCYPSCWKRSSNQSKIGITIGRRRSLDPCVNLHILKRLLWVCFEKYVVVVVYQVLKTVWLTFLWLCSAVLGPGNASVWGTHFLPSSNASFNYDAIFPSF